MTKIPRCPTFRCAPGFQQPIKVRIVTWFLYYMVAHFTLRTYGLNQEFRFDEGIWLHQKSHQIRFLFSEKDLVYIIRAQRKMSNHII